MAFTVVTNKNYVVGYDIGGTKIVAQLYKVTNGKISDKPIAEIKVKSKKTPKEMAAQVAIIAEKMQKQTKGGRILGLGIGMPGRFNEDGSIKVGTCPQYGEAFNGVIP